MRSSAAFDILVVDDDLEYLHSVRRVLIKDPYRVSITAEPNQAVAMMADQPFDVVV